MMETKSVTICGHCGMEQPMHSQFCFKCGTKVGKMTCGACGVTLPNGCQFCMGCGARLGENGERMFKVTFDRETKLDGCVPPCRIIINQTKVELLSLGCFVETYLSAGVHDLEVRENNKSQYRDKITITKDTVILVRDIPLWGIDITIP